MTDDKMKKIYGLIGLPLGHSFSKDFFNKKFSSENINAEYVNYEIPNIELFKEIIKINPNIAGMNVTIPYKEQVISMLDELDDDARNIGAVNVIKFYREKSGLKLKGYNSDVIGFCDSISPLLKPYHTHALILGTGGASKAIEYGLHKLGVETQLVSRTHSASAIAYESISGKMIEKYKVIVNTTPLGMYPHVNESPDIPYSKITSKHLCYDLIYNPDETLFLKKSKNHGATIKNGLEMLLLQAFASWNFWNS